MDGRQTVAANTKVLLTTLVPTVLGLGETIIRNIGWVHVTSDQAAATEYAGGALGAIVVTDIAAAAGVASIPGPTTNKDDDGWFLWVPTVSQFTFQSAIGFQSDGGNIFQFDSRGSRRMQEGYNVAFVFENESAVGVTVAFAVSTLTVMNT